MHLFPVKMLSLGRLLGIEPRIQVPQTCVLPLHHSRQVGHGGRSPPCVGIVIPFSSEKPRYTLGSHATMHPMHQWILFITLTVLMYLCISTIGKVSGSSSGSVFDSVRVIFRPAVLALVLGANALFAAAVFYGFQVTANAMTIAVSIGVVSTYVYSVMFTGVTVTGMHALGLALVIVGIVLLR